MRTHVHNYVHMYEHMVVLLGNTFQEYLCMEVVYECVNSFCL